ncbi:hypothetical protein GC175_13690 [bacterium]|nr:hypothetical protein [bacterium]
MTTQTFNHKNFGRWIAIFALVGMLLVLMTSAAFAQSSDAGDDVQPCESCHSMEAEGWMASTHAVIPDGGGEPYATCEDCHGAYVKGHPDEGVVALRVDSSMCQDCHINTFEQWEGTIHAEANVQCISCHVAHSQELRLTDETLCRACHQESLTDSFHTTHWYAEAACSDCHMSPSEISGAMAMTDNIGHLAAPTHDFTSVSPDNCLDCHRESVGASNEHFGVRDLALADLRTEKQRVAELDARLEAANQTSYTMQVMTPITLGFGIGVGGMLGIIFMLFAARYSRKDGE